MIRYLRHKEIDFEKWNTCIREAKNGNIYAYAWYLDALGNWDALVMGDYKAVCPLVYNRKWFGFRQIYQPYFCQQLGVFSPEVIETTMMDEFVATIPKKFAKVHFQCNEGNPMPTHPRFQYQVKNNYLLDLNQALEQIEYRFSRGLKYNLKKGKGLSIIKKDAHSIQEILEKYQNFLGKKGSKINWKKAQQLLEICQENGHLFSYSAYAKNGDWLASTLFLKSHQRFSYLIGVNSDTGRKKYATPALLHHLIQTYSGTNYVLDFEGSSIPSLANFFQSFGAKPKAYWVVEGAL